MPETFSNFWYKKLKISDSRLFGFYSGVCLEYQQHKFGQGTQILLMIFIILVCGFFISAMKIVFSSQVAEIESLTLWGLEKKCAPAMLCVKTFGTEEKNCLERNWKK